jgi:hypothetical protein
MAIYFPMVFLSVLLPWPRRGITEEVVRLTRLPGHSGLWVEQPHRAIGPAALYFILLGIVEVAVMTWIDPAALIPR